MKTVALRVREPLPTPGAPWRVQELVLEVEDHALALERLAAVAGTEEGLRLVHVEEVHLPRPSRARPRAKESAVSVFPEPGSPRKTRFFAPARNSVYVFCIFLTS